MTATHPTLSARALSLLPLARAAGAAIMAHYQAGLSDAESKGDGSPLTLADLASHRVICDGLAGTGLPVLSEESAALPWPERAQWTRYWLVDPLDGTKEFLARNGEFTVNIALIENGVAVLGCVYAPVLDLLYIGERGIGALRSDKGGELQPIRARPRQPSASEPLVVIASRRHGFERVQQLIADLPHTLDNRGSSLKICMVAEGSADLYPRLGPTSEWDTAAAQAVLEAAGGAMLDAQRQPLRYNRKDSVLNGNFFCFGRDHAVWSAGLQLSAN